MNRICRFSIALAVGGLAGCVGYGFPGSDSGYPDYGYPQGNQGRPDRNYPDQGYHDPDYGNAGYGTFRCESDNERTRHCDANTRGGVRINRQLSDSPCIEGRSWGYDRSGVWVSQGCRAEFTSGGGYDAGQGPGSGIVGGHGQTLRCESKDNRQQRCNAPVDRGVDIIRQLSDTRCVQGQNWGWNRGGIWVKGGCRAEFRIR